MLHYKNILVPHAGTQSGNTALKKAIEIAKECNGKITILSVVEQIPIPSDMVLNSKQSQIVKELQLAPRSFKKIIYEKMEKQASLCTHEKIKSVIRITHGSPDDEILRFYNENHIDLIVMAKKKDSEDKPFLNLGSNTRKILEHVSCPILIVGNEKQHREKDLV